MTLPNIVLFAAALATALMAGLFYSYSCSVNPGLGNLPDAEYLGAMQSINRAILNPGFFIAFFGAAILLPISAYLNYEPDSVRFWLLAGAAVFYGAGLFGVTILGNVPLNEMLDKFVPGSASLSELSAMRVKFEDPWNTYHVIRTVAVIVALVLVLAACLCPVKAEDITNTL